MHTMLQQESTGRFFYVLKAYTNTMNCVAYCSSLQNTILISRHFNIIHIVIEHSNEKMMIATQKKNKILKAKA